MGRPLGYDSILIEKDGEIVYRAGNMNPDFWGIDLKETPIDVVYINRVNNKTKDEIIRLYDERFDSDDQCPRQDSNLRLPAFLFSSRRGMKDPKDLT